MTGFHEKVKIAGAFAEALGLPGLPASGTMPAPGGPRRPVRRSAAPQCAVCGSA